MPKSSRHRSSKHSSRDARDYSDSDNDSSPKERRGGSEDGGGGVRASKDSGFSDKRKIDSKDSKDLYGSVNGEYAEDHGGSSKRRKDRASDRVSDRWNGGSEEGSSKVKPSSESKSRKRDEESEEVKRSAKSEHRESGWKEGRDSDRKERDGRGDKSTDNEDIATDSKTGASAESEIIEKRSRRKKDNYDTGDVKDNDKHTHSGDDGSKARRKDEKHKDERHRDDRHRDKYREEGDKDSRDRYEKQKDDYSEKDRNGSRSDKYAKSEKDTADDRQRKSKPRDNERDLESGRERDRAHYRDKDQDNGRDRDRDYGNNWDRDHDGDRDRERGRDRERDRDKERDRDLDHDQERSRDRERDRDRDLDDYSARHKDHRGKKRSPDDRDDYSESRPRSTKARNSETEKRLMSSSRVEADDRGRSQSHQGHSESTRRRGSPTSSAHGGADEYRLAKEDPKYKESLLESRARAISPLCGPADRGLKYPSFDRNNKMDDGRAGDFSAERSSSSKASPMGLSERSPSATSLERRNTNRNAARRNLDVEELNRKTGTDGRDFPIAEGRLSRDRPIEKPSGDEVTQADSSFHSKPGFSNTSSILAQPPRFVAESSPFRGSEEDSSRGNNNVRFRRNNDSGVGRGGYGNNNNWRGVPNWSSPVPNGFMPFQHGPHGNFQAMMPHFPTPPLFAVRPPMELNQSGMPYHLPDADRYPGHLRPFGWQNMIDASGLPRFHGWDGSGVLRDDPHMYSTPDWDQNRHMMNVRGWESNNAADTWKGHNGDVNTDLPSVSRKEEQPISATDLTNDGSTEAQGSDKGSSQQQKTWGRSTEIKQEIRSPVEEIPKLPSSKTSNAGKPDLSELSEGNDGMNLCRSYLSNLDISVELADPECYKQYTGLVEGKQTAIVNERPSVCMILAGFGRVVPQSSGASLSASVLPAVSKSITQRAIELYRKQRLEPWSIPVAAGGLVDLITSPKKKKLEEEEGKGPVVKLDEPIPEETLNSGTLIPSGNEMELVSDPSADNLPNDSITEEHDQGVKVEPMDVVESTEVEEEGGAAGSNKVSVPLVVESGEASMMHDSDESKMVNLSRIQQSPESTH